MSNQPIRPLLVKTEMYSKQLQPCVIPIEIVSDTTYYIQLQYWIWFPTTQFAQKHRIYLAICNVFKEVGLLRNSSRKHLLKQFSFMIIAFATFLMAFRLQFIATQCSMSNDNAWQESTSDDVGKHLSLTVQRQTYCGDYRSAT